MPRTDFGSRAGYDTVLASAARTTSGNSSAIPGFGAVSMLRVQLNVTAASGTTPTLDVTIKDSIDGGATWNVIGTFTQATTTTRQVVNVSAPFSDMIRAEYVIGGTTPSFTFAINAYSQ